MPTPKTIALYTSAEGHLSIAQAIAQVLEPEFKVVTFFEENGLFKVYRPIYQFFPAIFQVPYSFSKNQPTLKTFSHFFKRQYDHKIHRFFTTHHPALNISTYYMFNPSLEKLQEKHHVPLINIISDPRTTHPILLSSSAQVNFGFDEHQQTAVAGIDSTITYQSSGWFVRSEFEQKYDQKVVRTKLKLKNNRLTFLITAGSEGTTHIIKILPALFTASKPLQIIIACGNNKKLYTATRGLRKLLRTTNPLHTLIPLKFTTQMHEYMQAADLIIGKAGPNSLFEAVATKTPFFAITHISGQEDGNLDIIQEYNLGYVEENIFRAQKKLQDIIDHPEQLQDFASSLSALATHNQQAKEILVTKIKELLASPTAKR